MTRGSAEVEIILSLAAHDLRGPLGVVTGYLRILSQSFPDVMSPDSTRMVATIEKSAQLMVDTIDELGLLADLAGGALPINLVDVTVEMLVAPLAQIHESARALDVGGTAGHLRVCVDPIHMRHALGALVRCTAMAVEPGRPLAARHFCTASRPGRAVIAIGSSDSVEALLAADDWTSPGALKPRTVSELVADRLIEVQGGRLYSPPGRDVVVVGLRRSDGDGNEPGGGSPS